MHYTLTVALAGHIEPDELRRALDDALEPFSENIEVAQHRDTSPFAETAQEALAKMAEWYAELTEAELCRRDEEIRAKVAAGRAWEQSNIGFWRAWKAEYESAPDDAARLRQWDGYGAYDTDGHPLTTSNPDGHWDWWVVGGRWSYAWVLRDGAPHGPLDAVRDKHNTDMMRFGDQMEAPDDGREHTDNARWSDIVPESVRPTYAYLDLACIGGIGDWRSRERWEGRRYEQVPEPEWAAQFLPWLRGLPPDTWLVNVDYHC
jgi:hypothetical protein